MNIIYTRPGCPYCENAIKLFTDLEIPFEERDIYDDEDAKEALFEISGFRTFPQIFVWSVEKENCLGGFDDVNALHEAGELLPKFS